MLPIFAALDSKSMSDQLHVSFKPSLTQFSCGGEIPSPAMHVLHAAGIFYVNSHM